MKKLLTKDFQKIKNKLFWKKRLVDFLLIIGVPLRWLVFLDLFAFFVSDGILKITVWWYLLFMIPMAVMLFILSTWLYIKSEIDEEIKTLNYNQL